MFDGEFVRVRLRWLQHHRWCARLPMAVSAQCVGCSWPVHSQLCPNFVDFWPAFVGLQHILMARPKVEKRNECCGLVLASCGCVKFISHPYLGL